ncbi:alpha/beta fold hydrolase [Candidatus Woesearchaeota archaeon]|nr:alpha/beta fold hydrolase [Candidatus Woesearchaeota archaeon]
MILLVTKKEMKEDKDWKGEKGEKSGKESILQYEKPERIDLVLEGISGPNEAGLKEKEKKNKGDDADEKAHKPKWRSLTVKILTGLAAAAILAAIIFILFSKVIITIDDELTLRITPLQQESSVRNGESVTIIFNLKNDNLWQCDATCKFAFIDLRNNTRIYSGQEVLRHGQEVEKSIEIKAPNRGSGQILYSFEAECNNIKSVICLTAEEKRLSRAIALVSYDLPEEDKTIRDEAKPKIELLLSRTTAANEVLEYEKAILEVLPEGVLESDEISYLYDRKKSDVERISLETERLKQLWIVEDYKGIGSGPLDQDAYDIDIILTTLEELKKDSLDLIGLRNKNIDLLLQVKQSQRLLREMKSYFLEESTPENERLYERLLNSSDAIHNQYLFTTRNTSHSEAKTATELNQSVLELESVRATYQDVKAELYALFFSSRHKLILKGENVTNTTIDDPDCDLLKSYAYRIELANAEANKKQGTFLVEELPPEPAGGDAGSGNETENSTTDDKATPELVAEAELFLEIQGIDDAKKEIRQNVIDNKAVVLEKLDKKIPNATKPAEPMEAALSLALINNKENLLFISNNCGQPGQTAPSEGINAIDHLALIDLDELESLRITTPQMPSATANESEAGGNEATSATTLEDNPSKCCVYGNCSPCCDEPACKEEDYPILLIHGHAFNKDSHPDSVLNVFNNFERRITNDGLLSFGRLDMKAEQEQNMTGEWGRARMPVVIKASYYFITYYSLGDYTVGIKSEESIENYAIRLKEIIALVKQMTGKDKVNIVAHSMGGLVAREYVSLFGGGDVQKLITVNTPHHGVEGRVKEWCTFLGSRKECEELGEGSIFLSRLNSKELPANIQAYSIRSTGCLMEGDKTGDGVVTNESGILEGASNFEMPGDCMDAFKSDLHVRAMDPDVFPDMYALIIGLLKS